MAKKQALETKVDIGSGERNCSDATLHESMSGLMLTLRLRKPKTRFGPSFTPNCHCISLVQSQAADVAGLFRAIADELDDYAEHGTINDPGLKELIENDELDGTLGGVVLSKGIEGDGVGDTNLG